jgi:hypothetical protein
MDAPQEEFYTEAKVETLAVLFRIISQESRNELQGWHQAFPGSHIEHVLYGVYALIIPPGVSRRLEA